MDRPWVVEYIEHGKWIERCASSNKEDAMIIAHWLKRSFRQHRIRNVETGEIVEVRDDA